MITFNVRYFIAALILLLIEVLIALFVHDHFVRPYVGDLLVVILLYCGVKSVLNLSPLSVAMAVLVFSFCVEVLQYLNIVTLLGLQNSRLARIIIGTSFQWFDLLAYTMGILIVMLIEKWRSSSGVL